MPSSPTSGSMPRSLPRLSKPTQSPIRLSPSSSYLPRPFCREGSDSCPSRHVACLGRSNIGKPRSPLLTFGLRDSLVASSDSYLCGFRSLSCLLLFGLLLGSGSASHFHPPCLVPLCCFFLSVGLVLALYILNKNFIHPSVDCS